MSLDLRPRKSDKKSDMTNIEAALELMYKEITYFECATPIMEKVLNRIAKRGRES